MVWAYQHWITLHDLLQLADGVGAVWSLYEGDSLLGKGVDWLYDAGIPGYKRAIVPECAQCGADFMNISQNFTPFRQSIDLGGINLDPAALNSDPEVVNTGLVEQALRQFQVEVLLCK